MHAEDSCCRLNSLGRFLGVLFLKKLGLLFSNDELVMNIVIMMNSIICQLFSLLR
ncbi:hypothetical protein ACOSQ3_028444 [Xanthoceras sorbifolium]